MGPVLDLEVAASQGKFWEMYELLLRPSSRLDIDSLRAYAIQVGIDVAGIRRDLASHAYAARIERDVREGIRNGVNATPKFYVNGKRIDGAFPLEGLVDAVRAAVTAASAARADLAVAGLVGLLQDDARELDA